MIDFSTLVKIIFNKKKDYIHIEDKEKERLFFIFNRYMARNSVLNADALNKRGIHMGLATDIWFKFAEKTISIPSWFYPREKKGKSTTIEGELDSVDMLILEKFYNKEVNDAKIEKELEKKNEVIVVKKKKKKKK